LYSSHPALNITTEMEPPDFNDLIRIYDSRAGRYAAMHRVKCGFCNQGSGLAGGYNPLLGSWRGPFRDLEEASHHVLACHTALQEMRYCRRCV
jgi:hypothetical protein